MFRHIHLEQHELLLVGQLEGGEHVGVVLVPGPVHLGAGVQGELHGQHRVLAVRQGDHSYGVKGVIIPGGGIQTCKQGSRG